MKKYIALMFSFLYLKEVNCQSISRNDLYLTVQSLNEINGNYIIRATDAEEYYADTLTLISFNKAIYVDGELKNRIDSSYGNLLPLTIGRSYVFRIFKLVQKNCFGAVYSLVGGASWLGNYLKEAPFGVENGLADTIQYWNPILPVVDSVPTPVLFDSEALVKIQASRPKTLREKADRYIDAGKK